MAEPVKVYNLVSLDNDQRRAGDIQPIHFPFEEGVNRAVWLTVGSDLSRCSLVKEAGRQSQHNANSQ